MNIGRDTKAQLSNSEPIPKEKLQAGDLVFFQGTYREGVSHVGIYIGNGKFVHNSSNNGTIISSLDESYYKQHWLTGGRPNGVINTGSSVETENVGFSDKLKEWLGINKIMKNVSVIVIVALCIIGAVLFFLSAWDIDPIAQSKKII